MLPDVHALTIPNYIYLNNVIPSKELTLVAGLAGTGKTYTILKFLNLLKITPIHVNLDFSPVTGTVAYTYGDTFLHHSFITDDITGLTDRVVVIDTYQRFKEFLDVYKPTLTNTQICALLENFCKKHQCTLIVLGHPEDYVGKDGIFKDNPVLVRNAAEYIHIDSILPRGKTGSTSDIVYQTTIKKGRGSGGSRIINNWLREPMLNPLTNQMC